MFRGLAVDSDELLMLNGVLATACERKKLHDPDSREECARAIIALYSSGVTSREELLRRLAIIG